MWCSLWDAVARRDRLPLSKLGRIPCAFEVTYLLCNYTQTTRILGFIGSLANEQTYCRTHMHIQLSICFWCDIRVLGSSVRPSASQSQHMRSHTPLTLCHANEAPPNCLSADLSCHQAGLWLIDLFSSLQRGFQFPESPTTFLFPFTPPSLHYSAPSAELLPVKCLFTHTFAQVRYFLSRSQAHVLVDSILHLSGLLHSFWKSLNSVVCGVHQKSKM